MSWRKSVAAAVIAVASFHLAYAFDVLAWLMAGYVGGLMVLTGVPTSRRAFYLGGLVGLLVFVPQMGFLWTIFGVAAIPLWVVLAFWIGCFVLLGHLARTRLGEPWGLAMLPFLWLGLEYFRSELYFLRFSWFNSGYAFWQSPAVIGALGGMYGVGFWLAVLAAVLVYAGRAGGWRKPVGMGLAIIALVALGAGRTGEVKATKSVRLAGVQLEFPNHPQVIEALDRLILRHPDTELVVLSEYTFDGPIPESVKLWCRVHGRWLIAGGQDPLEHGNYYNTAFVVNPVGEIVFKQVKSVPIQFFKDGLPAPEQKLWNSPWGKIGICICYDLSFTRVADELVRQGAQLIIVPTMDVASWGRQQHELHGRVGPVRAAEYGVPVVRVCSSGVSQAIDARGVVVAAAPFPGDGEMLSATVALREGPGGLPVDRWLAPLAVTLTGWLAFWFCIATASAKLQRRHVSKAHWKSKTVAP